MKRAVTFLLLAAAGALAQSTPAPRKPAAPAATPSYKDLKYPELRPIVFPQVDAITLPNGLRVYLLEDHELPLVNGTVLVRTGTLFDPPDKIGLSALASQVLIEGGIASRPGDQMNRRFQDLGAEVATGISQDSLSISFTSLKESSDEVLDMLKDTLIAPEFQQDRLDFAKTRVRNSIAHRNDDGAAMTQREFLSTVYGKNTPFGAQIEYVNLDRINRADLMSFHHRYFFPGNVMLSLQGDFDAGAMKTRLQALFADWKNDQAPVPDFPKADTGGAPGRFLALKRDAVQTWFAIGLVGGKLSDKDYPALQILSDILGSTPRGRLNQKLHGASESISANWAAGYGYDGVFEIKGAINPFRTARVLEMVGQELNAIRTSEVTEEELRAAKDAALNSQVFTFDKQLSVMPRLALYQYFNYPKDYTEQYQKALESVTRADVLRVAKQYLNPSRMTTVVVGNPSSFDAQLESLGAPVTSIDLTIPPPKLEAALGDPATQRHGRELLARAQQAMGGADKLAAVSDYVQDLVYQFEPGAGGQQVTMTERWLAAGHLRQDTVTPSGKVSVYCDGKAGWVASGPASSALIDVQLKQVQSDLFRVLFSVILSDRAPGRKVNALDDNTVEVSDNAGQLVKLVFDSGSGLLKDMLYEAVTANGQLSVINSYSDYRDVGGIKLPSKVAVTVSGQKMQEVTVKNIQINAGIRLQDLEKRP